MYYLIKNTGEAEFRNLRLLGASSKRNLDNSSNSNYIGQFGSGFKYVLAMLSRLSIETIMFLGTKRIDIVTVDDEVCFKTENEIIPSSIHKNFGVFDWVDPWYIFRDLICNAIDAETEYKLRTSKSGDGFYFGETNVVEGVSGETRIYMKLDTKLMFAKNKVNEYIILDRTPMYDVKKSDKIVMRIHTDSNKIFKKGIYVQELKDAIFSYDFPELKLNEARSADTGDIRELLNRNITYVKDLNYYTAIFKNTNCYEYKKTEPDMWHIPDEVSPIIKAAFEAVHGENVVIVDDSVSNKTYAKLMNGNYVPVKPPYYWYRVLTQCGVKIAKDVLKESDNHDFDLEEPKEEDVILFNEFIDKFFKDSKTVIMPRFMFMTNCSNSLRGICLRVDNVIGINKDFWTSPSDCNDLSTDVKITLFEECMHFFCKLDDFNRKTQDYLIKRIIEGN